jgi:iron complex transport system ATP-binding protein
MNPSYSINVPAESNDPLLAIRELNLTIGQTQILKGISFELYLGQRMAVLGSNGAGKSSLVKIIAGLLPASSGQIYIAGTKVTDISKIKLASLIGYVPQRLNVSVDFNVYEFLALSLYPKNLKHSLSIRREIEPLAEMLNMQNLLTRTVRSLSGGEFQRTLIAAALVHKPKILILDEPLNALDPLAENELSEMMARIHQEHSLTSISVSHNIAWVLKYCDRVIALKSGSILLDDSCACLAKPETIQNIYGVGKRS